VSTEYLRGDNKLISRTRDVDNFLMISALFVGSEERSRIMSQPSGSKDVNITTEIPSFLKQLARLIAQGFYQVEDALIVDMLVRNPCKFLEVCFFLQF
jgi:hypothetical protein